MVWFSDFQDVFQKIDRDLLLPLRKKADVEAAKAAEVAKSKAKDLQTAGPGQDPEKNCFRGSYAATELRRIVK